MKNKNLFVLLLLLAIGLVAFGSTFLYVKLNNKADYSDDLIVMTSCNPVYIATLNIVGDAKGIKVENLSQPTTGCLHDYTLTAEDMKNLANADVLVINGGGMEGYLDDVIEAYPDLAIINSMEDQVEDEQELRELDNLGINYTDDDLSNLELENSHCWLSVAAYEKQIATIADGIASIDEDNADIYYSNANNYEDIVYNSLSQYIDKIKSQYEGDSVVILHEAYEYVAYDMAMDVAYCMDLDEERQVSANEVSDLMKAIEDNDVEIIFAEEDYGKSMGDLIEEQTGAKVIYLETLIHGTYTANDYVEVMEQNYKAILEAE